MGTIPSLFQENPPAFHLGFTHFPGQIRDHPLVLRRKIGYNETSFRRVCRRYHNENKPVARLWRNQMDNSDWRRIGEQISETGSRALSSREFREIQGTIQNTVHEIQTAFKNEFSGYAPQTPPAPPPAVPPRKTKTRAPGRTAGTLLLVFGAIGFGAAALTALISSVLALTSDRILPFMGLGIGVFLPLLAVFGGMMLGGGALRRRAQRYLRYREELGDSAFCPVGVLASAVGKRPRFVARDLRRMIGLGLFPGARVDDEGTCLMLDDETYRYYLAARQKRDEEAGRRKKTAPETTAPSDEAQSVIAEGRRLLDRIRACNDEIPGEAISRSLDRLDEVAAAIFAYVEAHPAKLPEIRRFLNYYLPTTLRLLEAYKSFSGQPVQGKHLDETRAQIEGTVDTVVQAFSNLLDGLMQDDMRDVSADMTVMKSLMEQEGLTGGFPRPKP